MPEEGELQPKLLDAGSDRRRLVAGEAVAATAEEEVAVADAVKEALLGNDFFVAVKSSKGNNNT